jgi:predicted adenine nucleotide alpha hydrolase (AANH) superfamily ATPase
LTILYNNSNIFPEAEFWKRLEEVRKLISYMKRDYGFEIKLVAPPYRNEEYMKDLEPYGDLPEGGERCWVCYHKRMKEAYDYAEKENFDYFCTVMTISREKNSLILNHIGEELEKTHSKTKYFYSDFKKHDGALIGVNMRKGYDLYYQKYCGCEFSLESRLKWDAYKASLNQKLDVK